MSPSAAKFRYQHALSFVEAPRSPGAVCRIAVWRKSLGHTGNTAADANEDDVVDLDDYNFWKGNFGATAGQAASLPSLAIPR